MNVPSKGLAVCFLSLLSSYFFSPMLVNIGVFRSQYFPTAFFGFLFFLGMAIADKEFKDNKKTRKLENT